ncbi:Uncharacterized conserved protein YloU, alkaline shock protein (Asp23) family [Desulfofundulus australicus DSM 11792]|uniref:Uncharacterized conserved protein YloU, alkaline shock protein (Asp23) family n=1 Tax=Desulfofundulus australicus DSM 11792 TaxID=1121425 RepID=A0A1M5BVP2_9FIRM|nr:Asp23/Gls24 family envelope stress response protein [Desulfofundulus australicus]SHF46599.1 Uncharacterized conserved protein YloU, alkaline shock protein (Asp23) family [Desulfofundulus australicus DSM 11792]
MEVYALVGPSGTGKSHRAITTAHECGAELIIDDGLLIKGNRILGGISAKRQPTRIGAIKTALFMDEEHARQARAVLEEAKPSRVLILGTSLEMVEKIAFRLGLPPVSRVINIEEIASPREIRQALDMRARYSKHVIPAPTVEVKKRFPEIFADSIKIFLGRQSPQVKRSWLEQSVVRPAFTCYGKLTITTGALVAIISRVAEEVPGVKSSGRVYIKRETDGVFIELHPVLYYGYVLNKVGREIQLAVKERVEEMTGLVVKSVNILVRELHFPKGKEPA